MTTAAACATIPAVVVTGYAEKGEWIELAGLKTYVTGSPSSTKAIVDVYDIFGPAPQTLQGADLLATALGALVIVPDFFKGSYMKSEWMADSSEEVGKLKGAFMAVAGEFAAHSAKIGAVVAAGREKWNIESWGALGLCWGGKVAVLSSGEGSPFKVTGQVHPGRLAAADAENVVIPHIVLASKGEDVDVVKAYAKIFEGKEGVVETYGTMHHGWMGARANLEDGANLKEYERGYNQIAQYFEKFL